ncbi:poly(ADP-ribose) glycohydrolase 1-like isoform X2 [Ananas comosus]|uniref:poly(ADP-ribose) glycohydrolase n=1 Tax=Ananas comosus TaxID=4615 RepID=A0A6P5GID5_ANACO|nr:poly(ADP-ribose) glycohydrolase 1-like isoform X2 [Ananas comosus]
MAKWEDVESILPYLPLILRSSSSSSSSSSSFALFWPPRALESLKALALGPDVSRVASGEVLFDAILDLRDSIGLSQHPLAHAAADGFALFFDELMSRMDARVWFGEIVPTLARLLLQLPSLLEAHYQKSDEVFGKEKAGLRVLGSQEAGIVFLSQELIGALLACALFCLFPTSNRDAKLLPAINFDYLFANLYPNARQSQEQKVRCLIHYFERISLSTPTGFVSFERKVIPLQRSSSGISYPEADDWRISKASLCQFKVLSAGLIEDQQDEALEVDFANEYLGGGALHRGCVQEEIRFMINPELIAGMLFMASMRDNEAIEIVGVERFSQYMGYSSSFRFVGDYIDRKPFDLLGRRKTRIIAIDALDSPRLAQYKTDCLLRETNKAFCGFFDRSKHRCYLKHFQMVDSCREYAHESNADASVVCKTSQEMENQDNSENRCSSNSDLTENNEERSQQIDLESIGIATGNWGCGAFGGDPEMKSMIQWLAASQALRPFIHYYTFGEASLERLQQVTEWISGHGWTVCDLWSMLVEYSTQRLRRETNVGFFAWLLPGQSSTSDMQYMSQ